MRRILAVAAAVLCLAVATRAADIPGLVEQLKSRDADTRRAAARGLAEAGTEARPATAALIDALRDSDLFVRRYAAQALGDIGPDARSAVPALTSCLNDRHKQVQEAAAEALGKIGPASVSALVAAVRDGSKEPLVRRRAAESLARIGAPAHSAVPALTTVLAGERPAKGKKKKGNRMNASDEVRLEVVNALGALATSSDKETLAALEALTDKRQRNRTLKAAANSAIRKIQARK